MEEARARDVILRGMLGAIREGHPAGWCKRELVKPLRRLLTPPHNVSHVSPQMEKARSEAEASVIKFCGMCSLPYCKVHKLERAAE